MVLTGDDVSACWPRARRPAAGGLRRGHGQFRAEVVEMQEGHGPGDRPESEGDGGTSPGASWVPWAGEEQEAPAGPPTTELGTWTMSAGGQGTWEPPPGGGHGGWGPPPAGGGRPPPRRDRPA